MKDRLLFVDDEEAVLQGYKRRLSRAFELDTALGGSAGLDLLATSGPYSVVVSDMKMPGMDGVEFLRQVKKIAPTTVRIMLTGNGDKETAIQAVNEGNVFRFLEKPCPAGVFSEALVAGIQQHHVVRAEAQLLKRTVRSAINVLVDVLGMANPVAFGRASILKTYIQQLALRFDLTDLWKYEVAALLSQVGCIALPSLVLEKLYGREAPTEEEKKIFDSHPQVGFDLISQIPKLESVAEMILLQEKRFDGTGPPQDDSRRGEQIPIGARLLKIVSDFVVLENAGVFASDAFERMAQRAGWYDPHILEAFRTVVETQLNLHRREVSVLELSPGMVLAQDVYSLKEKLLVSRGQKMTNLTCQRLRNFRKSGGIQEPINVYHNEE